MRGFREGPVHQDECGHGSAPSSLSHTRVEEFDRATAAAQIASGHATAAPSSSLMKSRHRLNCIRSPIFGTEHREDIKSARISQRVENDFTLRGPWKTGGTIA